MRGHHGGLKVTSKPGQGSTFRVLFPVLHERKLPEHPAADPPAPADCCIVLVVDDESTVRETARTILEHLGYSVLTAEDGREALAVVRQNGRRVNLVLLDMTMPVMSGEETLDALRDLNPELQILVSTGYTEDEAMRRFSGQKTAGFVQKPYTAARLSQKVRDALQS